MDHIEDANWPQVAEASHSFIVSLRQLGLDFRMRPSTTASSVVTIDGHVSAGPARENEGSHRRFLDH